MVAKSMPSNHDVNSVGYWDRRFDVDWESRGGRKQTAFFAEIALKSLSDWLIRRLEDGSPRLMDVGCALGEAGDVMRRVNPGLEYLGVDVSKVAIGKAGERFPDCDFRVVRPNWSDLPSADFILCSNTLEHLRDWRMRIDLLCRRASREVFILVPYREEKLEREHVARFDERVFPVVACDKRLIFLRVVDAARLPESQWNGRQILAVYGSSKGAPDARRRAAVDLASGLDLRGLDDREIEDALIRAAQVVEAERRAAGPTPPGDPAAVAEINSEWQEKFKRMVADFEQKHGEFAAHHQKTVSGLEDQIRQERADREAELQRIAAARDAAVVKSEAMAQKLAFAEEHSAERLALTREFAEREAALKVQAAELDFEMERLVRSHEIETRTAQVAELERRIAELSVAAAEVPRLEAERSDAEARLQDAEARRATAVDALEQKLAAQAEERSRREAELTEQVALLAGKLDRRTAEHAATVSRLTADLTAAQDVRRRLEDASEERSREHAQEVERLLAAQREVVSRLESERAAAAARLLDAEARHAVKVDALAQQSAAEAEEWSRREAELTEQMALLSGKLDRRTAEHAAEVSRLTAGLAAAQDARQRLEDASEVRSREQGQEFERLLAAHRDAEARHAAAIGALAQQSAAEAEERSRREVELTDRAARLTDEVERLVAALAERDARDVRIRAEHEVIVARLVDHVALAEREAADLREASAAERESMEAERSGATLRIEALLGELDGLRRDVARGEAHAEATRAHYERHLEEINRYLDTIATTSEALIGEVTATAQLQVDALVHVALRNTRIARANADAAAARERSRQHYPLRSIVERFLGKPPEMVFEPLAPMPPAGATLDGHDAVRRLRETLTALFYDKNPTGASDYRRSNASPPDQLAAPLKPPRDQAPPSAEPLIAAVDDCVVAMQLEAFDTGGLERVVFDLALGFRGVGKKVIVLCRRGGRLAEELTATGIAVYLPRDVGELRRHLTDNCVTDLFLHHSYFGFDEAVSLGIRVYDVVHNTYFWKLADPSEVGHVGRSSAAVVCVSSAVRDFHARAFDIPTDRMRVINNPVNVDGFIVPERNQLRRIRESVNHTTFINVANYYPAKAQVGLITAFAEAMALRPEIRLLIAGAEVDPRIGDELRRLLDIRGLRDSVKLLGHCDRRELGRHYAQSHAFLLPSVYEGYSISALEAATYGLPLVMTDVGGARDLIVDGDCGILLPAIVNDLAGCTQQTIEAVGLADYHASSRALIDAMVSIAEDRNRWIERGLVGMTKPHPLDAVIRDYLKLMSEAKFRAVDAERVDA